MSDGLYMDVEITDYDIEHFGEPMPTYDKDEGEKMIKLIESISGRPLPEDRKQALRNAFVYVGE